MEKIPKLLESLAEASSIAIQNATIEVKTEIKGFSHTMSLGVVSGIIGGIFNINILIDLGFLTIFAILGIYAVILVLSIINRPVDPKKDGSKKD